MRSIFFALLGLMATPLLAAPKPQTNAFEAFANLTTVPGGYLHVADDGVARSYDGNDVVIDFVRLTNEQLMQLLPQLPDAFQKDLDHLHQVFDGVNGVEVEDEDQLRNPPAWLRPARDQGASKRSAPSHSRNPMRDVESTLETRDFYCVGQPCVSGTGACEFLGCSPCLQLAMDGILPGLAGICPR